MSVAFQFLDVAIIAFVLISAIFATYRGFVAESLSIFAWAAAAFATLYFGPWTAMWMRDMVSPSWLGEIVGYAVVFIVVLLPVHFASSRFAENVKKSQVGTLDGALGAAFGVLRGLVVVGIVYLAYTSFVPVAEQPGWIARARLMPVIRGSAEIVASLIPDQDAPRHRHVVRSVESPMPTKAAEKPHKTAHPAPAPVPVKHSKKTYGAKDRQALDRLIETTGDDESGKP
jgi:membrane protein required for colicin V production